MKEEKKFIKPQADIYELPIIDTLLNSDGEEIDDFGEGQVP